MKQEWFVGQAGFGPIAILVCSLLLASCGSSSGSSSGPIINLDAGLNARPSNTTCLAPETPGQAPSSVALSDAFPALPGLNRPIELLQRDGDSSHFYVAERGGRVLRFANTAGADSLELVLDISAKVDFLGSEGGLLGIAFHPQAAVNRKLYVSYTTASGGPARSVIARFTLNADFSSVDPASEQAILELNQPAGNHNGGHIEFGPDGFLYIGFGDGGNDPDEAQDRSSLFGALLRIDVNPDTNTPPFYSIPADNPLVNEAGSAGEIYAFGLRNPWRWAFDPQSGQLWAADVGAAAYEEINHIRSGGNYGWPTMEGAHCRRDGCDSSQFVQPVFEYPRSNGRCSIIGGHVYRGTRVPGLNGSYLYSDYCTGEVWSLSPSGDDPNRDSYRSEQIADVFSNVSAFGQDANGEVYVLPFSDDARILQLSPTASGDPADVSNIPERLSQSGCFVTNDPRQPAAGLIPFDVLSPLWSDGADKERFMALPNGATVDLDARGDFDFPVGTVLAKHFSHNNTMIETRLFMHHRGGWAGYSYEWRADQSDAILLGDAKDARVAGLDWHFPSRAECMQCHTRVKNFALAPEVLQLNHSFSYPTGRSANQIDTLQAIGVFSAPPSSALGSARLFALDDGSASLELRAKSYLHSNCSNCHQPGGSGNSGMDLRFETALADMNICDVAPANSLGIADARLIAPASPAQSIILHRMRSTGGERMPPLASNVVDEQAVALLEEWISTLHSCP